jgi:hypothetical protein
MTEDQQAAYVNAQAAAAQIHATAMVAANKEREADGKALAYDEAAFMKLLDDYGLHHNTLMTLFHH